MRVRSQQPTSAVSAADALLGSTAKQQELPKASSGEMDWGELVYRLKGVIPPVMVKIGHVAQWTLVQRLQARAWLEGTGVRPEFLDPFVLSAEQPIHEQGKSPPAGMQPIVPSQAATAAAISTQLPISSGGAGGSSPSGTAVVGTAGGAAGGERVEPEPVGYDRNEVPLFASANKGPGINPDFARIVETLYQVDAFREYADLEANLEVGEQRGDRATLREHLDKAQKRARRAHALLIGAKLERSNWERDAEVTNAAMRNTAHAELAQEKKDGERKKMITDADVTSRVAERFADEWRAQEITRHKFKGVENSLEHLVKCWDSKVHSLSTLLESLK